MYNQPPKLYVLCLEHSIKRIEQKKEFDREKINLSMERLGASIATDMLAHAFEMANKDCINKIWKDEWEMFYMSGMVSAIVSWDYDLIKHIGNKCKKMRRLEVIHVKKFKPDPILVIPETLITLDFEGDLINRGLETKTLQFEEESTSSWLPHAEEVLKALQVLRKKPPEYVPTPGIVSLCELHLGNISATAADLKIILQNCPCLRILRHYQLVSALYELHADAWKKKEVLPGYKLKNLDADFSHVVRTTLLPTWVLAPNALQLAVQLCPNAISIRLRFDNSTPNDVIAPLMSLEKIKEFSAVCVSSGERVLLDFTDMSPIFQKYGPLGLSFLELKVIEEVEIHVIIENCTKIETLILSGCGYVTPPTCGSYNCEAYGKGSLSKKLKLLFYVDGDDFSWDHGVPECFWIATLYPSGKNRIVHLEGLFLELPRITAGLAKEIFHPPQRLPFPELKVLSLCKFDDLTMEDVAAIAGLSKSEGKNLAQHSVLKYVRLTECEKIDEGEGKKLHNWFKEWDMNKIKLQVDR